MQSPVTPSGNTAFTDPIPWFAGKPSHPFVPLGFQAAVARSGGQGRPQAGASRAPLTGASTMARSHHGGGGAGSCFALLLFAGLFAIGMPEIAVAADSAPMVRSAPSDPYATQIADAARRFGIPVGWIRAVMRVESRGDARAVSPKGALGLMQLMPATWAAMRSRYGLGRDAFDPRDNILAGAAYLREMYDAYGSPGFLAAYSAGPGRYEDYRDRHRPLPAETIAYVSAIVPFVDAESAPESLLFAASSPSSWRQASLFVGSVDGSPAVGPATSDRPSRDMPAGVSVHDLSALAPQSDGLFVAVSTTGRSQ